jgi:hypothetical protein
MKTWRGRLSRREAVLVAAALLLPIPIFAQSGLSVPLPGVVERGLGSLVNVEATDERSGTSTTGQAAENGKGDRRSARGSLRISRAGLSPDLLGGAQTGSDSGGSAESGTSAGEDGGTDTTPAGGDPNGARGGQREAGAPGDPTGPRAPASDSAGGSRSGADSGSGDQAGVSVTAAGQGTGTTVSAGTGGLSVGVGADNGGAGGNEPGSVAVVVNDEDGSTTGGGTTLPGVGVVSP